MTYLKYIPVAGMIINVAACIGYIIIRDYARAAYWILACLLTATTFWIR
jgi:hypothetical protein